MSESPENTQENKPELHPSMEAHKWQPGQSGNPGGRPKKTPLTDLYAKMLNDPALVDTIEAAVKKAVSKGQMAMVLQLREMAERVEGKVTQPVDANLNVNMSLSERMQRAKDRLTKE